VGTSGYRTLIVTDHAFSGNGIRARFVGQSFLGSGSESPGIPSADPDHAPKLQKMFGNDQITYYPVNSHSNRIGELSARPVPNSDTIHYPIPDIKDVGKVIPVDADAFVACYDDLPDELRKHITLALRTWDCSNLIFHNLKWKTVGIVHASVRAEGGYKSDHDGGIIGKTIALCGGTKDLFVAVGPCISGMASPSQSPYEWDTEDAMHLLDLVRKQHPNIPSSKLDKLIHPKDGEKGKVYLDYGKLIALKLEDYGVKENHIDFSNNIDTFSTRGWFSERHTRQVEKQTDLSEKEMGAILLQRKCRFGNIAAAQF
jgi:copper oxidase (laccase) domain-containing protein